MVNYMLVEGGQAAKEGCNRFWANQTVGRCGLDFFLLDQLAGTTNLDNGVKADRMPFGQRGGGLNPPPQLITNQITRGWPQRSPGFYSLRTKASHIVSKTK